jgi:GNAT superfamily N-acetyltransferase
MEARELTIADRAWAGRLVCEHFGSPRIVSRGVLHDARRLPGVIAEADGTPVGLLQYQLEERQLEVVVLIAARRGRGVGRLLLRAAERIARSHGCRRLWLITTNDNRAAIGFYRAAGWREVARHRGAVREARSLKPGIPELAADGTPIEDELEFELLLQDE